MKKKYKTLVFLIAVLFVILFKSFIMDKVIVQGDSMLDSYHSGDVLWIDKISFRFNEIERFDVVVVSTEKGNIIKRIIGLPYETIVISYGIVYINGIPLEGDYGEKIINGGIAETELMLGDKYFVLGDNRNNSDDSREAEIGAVSKGQIIGKPFFRYYPFSRFGKVN